MAAGTEAVAGGEGQNTSPADEKEVNNGSQVNRA